MMLCTGMLGCCCIGDDSRCHCHQALEVQSTLERREVGAIFIQVLTAKRWPQAAALRPLGSGIETDCCTRGLKSAMTLGDIPTLDHLSSYVLTFLDTPATVMVHFRRLCLSPFCNVRSCVPGRGPEQNVCDAIATPASEMQPYRSMMMLQSSKCASYISEHESLCLVW